MRGELLLVFNLRERDVLRYVSVTARFDGSHQVLWNGVRIWSAPHALVNQLISQCTNASHVAVPPSI